MTDPDDPRQWYAIVPLLLIAAGFGVFLAIRGAWIVIGVALLATAFAGWAHWQSGKPLWPRGPRRRR